MIVASVAADANAPLPGAVQQRYTRGAIWFHWTIAALIIANLVIGIFRDAFPPGSMGVHKAIGISVLFLSIARLVWRWTHARPPLATHLRRWEVLLAELTHRAFYVLMIAVPLAGWLLVSASPKRRPLTFFGLFDIPYLPVARSAATDSLWQNAHEVLAFGILGLLALHVAGALKHQLIDRDRELARMGVGRQG